MAKPSSVSMNIQSRNYETVTWDWDVLVPDRGRGRLSHTICQTIRTTTSGRREIFPDCQACALSWWIFPRWLDGCWIGPASRSKFVNRDPLRGFRVLLPWIINGSVLLLLSSAFQMNQSYSNAKSKWARRFALRFWAALRINVDTSLFNLHGINRIRGWGCRCGMEEDKERYSRRIYGTTDELRDPSVSCVRLSAMTGRISIIQRASVQCRRRSR